MRCIHLFLLVMICLAATLPAKGQEIPMPDSSTTHSGAKAASSVQPAWIKDSLAKMQRELGAKYGDQQSVRVERGLRQVGEFWRAEDGDAAAFEEFVRVSFAGDQATLDTMFDRFQRLLERGVGPNCKCHEVMIPLRYHCGVAGPTSSVPRRGDRHVERRRGPPRRRA